MKRMFPKKDRGSATIEATISLTLFIFVIMAIYILVNFCIVQQRVGYAINSSAKEMSQYAYFYHVAGLDKMQERLNNSAQDAIKKSNDGIDAVKDFSSLLQGGSGGGQSGADDPFTAAVKALTAPGTVINDEQLTGDIERLAGDVGDVASNPVAFAKSIVAMGGQAGITVATSHLIAAPLAKTMSAREFGGWNQADQTLESMGVENGLRGMNFNLSTLFAPSTPDDINITVVYTLNLAKFTPFKLDVTLCQSAATKAWLGGDMDVAIKKSVGGSSSSSSEGMNFWTESGLQRGTDIVNAERDGFGSAGIRKIDSSGFEGYNSKSSALVSIHSIDPMSGTYSSNDGALLSKLRAMAGKARGAADSLDSVTCSDGCTVKLIKNKPVEIILIIPENSGGQKDRVNRIISSNQKAFGGVTFQVEAKYGDSPNAGKGTAK